MNSRLIQNALIVAAVPFITILLLFIHWDSVPLRLIVLIVGTLAQIPVVLLCKRDARRMFNPSIAVLETMDIASIPAAYEPGKFSLDCRISSVLIWAGMLAPALAYYAKLSPKIVEVTVLNFLQYTAPDINLLGLAFLSILVGAMALCFWAKVAQASVIANAGGERKRYLYRGFAELTEDKAFLQKYLSLAIR